MTIHRPRIRATVGASLAATFLVAIAAPAAAHVTVSPSEAPAAGYQTVELSVPHGCDGEATAELSVQLTQEVQSVKAQSIPGWEVTYERAELDEPFDNHGITITEYVSTITWTSTGDPLPDDQYMTFGISARWPDAAGDEVLLPAVQRCPSGAESAWIETDPDAEHPAPRVTLFAADGGHGDTGDDGTDDASDEPVVSSDGATDEAAAPSSDDGSSDGLAIVALVLGIAALLASGVAVMSARRS